MPLLLQCSAAFCVICVFCAQVLLVPRIRALGEHREANNSGTQNADRTGDAEGCTTLWSFGSRWGFPLLAQP